MRLSPPKRSISTCSKSTSRRLFLLAGVALLPGCFGGPKAVEVPPIQSEPVATAIMSQFDKNGDGRLNQAELAGSPSLLDGMKNLDTDGDQSVSQDELVHRLTTWVEGGIGISFFSCRVTWKGRPLSGAEVQLIPEPYLSDVLQPATGTTGPNGIAKLGIDKSKLPSDMQNFRGVQQGYYRVEITHPTENLPAKYNSASTLGLEVSFDRGRNSVDFKL